MKIYLPVLIAFFLINSLSVSGQNDCVWDFKLNKVNSGDSLKVEVSFDYTQPDSLWVIEVRCGGVEGLGNVLAYDLICVKENGQYYARGGGYDLKLIKGQKIILSSTTSPKLISEGIFIRIEMKTREGKQLCFYEIKK